MTDTQKRVLQGLIDGKTYSDIAREMGITRQAVHNYAQNAVKVGQDRALRECKYYPNLAAWIYDEFRSAMAFSKKCGISYPVIRTMLSEGREPSWRIVKRLCEITGMTAEELMLKIKDEDVQKDIQEND